jgi:acetyl-CoA carboxylase carboxyltransferase component
MSEEEQRELLEEGRARRQAAREPSGGRGNPKQKSDQLLAAQERIAAMSPDEQRALLEAGHLDRLRNQEPSGGRERS